MPLNFHSQLMGGLLRGSPQLIITMNINKTSTLKEMREVTGASPLDNLPTRLGDTILPVLDLNPRHGKVSDQAYEYDSFTTLNNTTIITLPTGKLFHVTGLSWCLTNDVLSDNVGFNIVGLCNAKTSYLLFITRQTLTAQTLEGHKNFSSPIILDEGSTIKMDKTNAAGASRGRVIIFGYFVDKV